MEIKKINKFIKSYNEIKYFLSSTDRKHIELFVKKIQDKINIYDTDIKLDDLCPTKTEYGKVNQTFKKVIYGYYLNPILKKINKKTDLIEKKYDVFGNSNKWTESTWEKYYKEIDLINYNKDKIKDEFYNVCNKIKIPEKIKANYILFRRNIKDGYNPDYLEREIVNAFKIKFIEIFSNTKQGKELINKYI